MNFPPDFFDAPVDRRESDSLKWGRYAGRDVIPLWIADMDFRSPPAVAAALGCRAAHGVYGYARDSQAAVEAMIDYHREHYGWSIERAWVVPVPGLVCALNVLCRAVGDPGDAVATTVPVYPPFLDAPRLSGRRLVTASMTTSEARQSAETVGGRPVPHCPLPTAHCQLPPLPRPAFDLAALDAALTPDTRLFILCSPHNPLGRNWSPAELRAVIGLCRARGLTVCSDEVHGGLVLDPPHAYTPSACAAPEHAGSLVTLIAPSKTYNLPGLSCAFAVIPDPALRQRFRDAMEGIVPHVNLFGYVAAEAAYRHGEEWRLGLLDYLRANRDAVERATRTWGVAMPHVEATYLAWLDFRPFLKAMGGRSPARFLLDFGVGLMDGDAFGAPGFARLNFATTRALLDEALSRIDGVIRTVR
jgi:cystathionine beta-lyase